MATGILTPTPTVAQTSDLDQGRWLYRNGIDIACCTTEAMRSGWQLAEREMVEWFQREASDVEAMDAALAEHRAAPVVYLNDEQMAEVETEQIGLDEFEHRMMW